MVVFEEELENYFDNFTDLAQSFPLFHGKRHEDEDLDEDKAVGYFKVRDTSLAYYCALNLRTNFFYKITLLENCKINY